MVYIYLFITIVTLLTGHAIIRKFVSSEKSYFPLRAVEVIIFTTSSWLFAFFPLITALRNTAL